MHLIYKYNDVCWLTGFLHFQCFTIVKITCHFSRLKDDSILKRVEYQAIEKQLTLMILIINHNWIRNNYTECLANSLVHYGTLPFNTSILKLDSRWFLGEPFWQYVNHFRFRLYVNRINSFNYYKKLMLNHIHRFKNVFPTRNDI